MRIDFGDALDKTRQDLIDGLFPGLGYFGNSNGTEMSVNIQSEVDAIELVLEGPYPELINITEICFYDQSGKKMERSELVQSVQMSSVYGEKSSDDIFQDFVAGRMLHTHREKRPCILIKLKRPMTFSFLTIANRQDVYGYRSRFLSVRGIRNDFEITRHNNLTAEIAERKLFKILDLAGEDLRSFNSREEVAQFCANVRRRLTKLIEHDKLDMSLLDIIELMPVYDGRVEINKFHITCCAHTALKAWGDKKVLNTSFLKPFGRLISSDLRIRTLKTEMERLIEIREGQPASIVISRHHIHRSNLIRMKDQYLEAINQVVSVLAAQGVVAMLGYGTLLGAVRENGFMTHDDDVDLIVFDGSTSQEMAQVGKEKIINMLNAAGAGARESGYWHLHANVKGMIIDLFPAWQEGGSWMLPMEQLRIRAVPTKNMYPASTVNLYGHRFPAPADCPAFLADRYGEGWVESDPYYEWPWPLERIETRLKSDTKDALLMRRLIQRKHFGRLCRVAWGQRVANGSEVPPMNSLCIIDVAKETGYDAVELDVLISADGVAVLGHDDQLFGPDGSITVSRASSSELVRFKLGYFRGREVTVATLQEALQRAGCLDVQIDSRIKHNQVVILRSAVNAAGFDPTRLQFCVYNVNHAQALLKYFPESVLLWKTYRLLAEHDEHFLDEAHALGMDGVMISVPRNFEDYTGFMEKLRDRGLRVLMFIHSGDEAKLKRMVSRGVDYVTTLAHNMKTFKNISGGVL